jgi:hypothetical protein
MPKGYQIGSWKFLNGIGKPLGNAQIPAVSQQERIQNCPAVIDKKCDDFC